MPLPVATVVHAIPLRTSPHVQLTAPVGATRMRVSAPAVLYLRTGDDPAEIPQNPTNSTASSRLQADTDHVRAVTAGQVVTFVADVAPLDTRLGCVEFS